METNGLWDGDGFQDVPLRGVREGWLETKGRWEWIGFQNVALRGINEGWMETKWPWKRVGFRKWLGRTSCWGNVETN